MSDRDKEQSQRRRVREANRTSSPATSERRPDPDLPGAPASVKDEIEGVEGKATGAEAGPPVTGREASLWADAWRELRSNAFFLVAAVLIVLFVIMAVFPKAYLWFYPGTADPRVCDLSLSLERPSAQHWFGYDIQGCDYYANVIYGARVSIFIGTVTVAFAMAIAVLFGSIAAYYGGWLDTVIARLTDVWLALPFILGGLVAITVLRNPDPSVGGIQAFLSTIFEFIDGFLNINGFGVVAFVLIVLGWPTMLRLMRSAVLEEQEKDYVDAARALGASDPRIISKHILPNAIAPVIVFGTIYVGLVISAEAALSYLGVGLQLPAISWGLMINQAQARILGSPHLLFFPGVFLSVAVFAFILMGDALRDALDPKLR